MTTTEQRIQALERAATVGGWQTLDVIDRPTPEQQAQIDHCTRTRTTLVVFYELGMTAWIASCGTPPPWAVGE